MNKKLYDFIVNKNHKQYRHTVDWDLADIFKFKIYSVMKYFKEFDNELRLLENLEKWCKLYGNTEYLQNARKLKAEINRMLYNGKFYCNRGFAGYFIYLLNW